MAFLNGWEWSTSGRRDGEDVVHVLLLHLQPREPEWRRMQYSLCSDQPVRQMASVMNLCSALCQMANVYILAISQYSDNPDHRRNHPRHPQTRLCNAPSSRTTQVLHHQSELATTRNKRRCIVSCNVQLKELKVQFVN